MSIAPVAKRSMRILALPLVAASKTPETTPSTHLTYYHFATPPPRVDKGKTWTQWTTDKAAGLWAGFGKAPEGTWKVLPEFIHTDSTRAFLRELWTYPPRIAWPWSSSVTHSRVAVQWFSCADYLCFAAEEDLFVW